jgi:preprotein translocase subunit Sss1
MAYREFIEFCKELRRLQEQCRKPMTRYEHSKAKKAAQEFERKFDKLLKEL